MVSCRAGTPIPAQQAQPAPCSGRRHLRRLARIFETIAGPIYYLTCCVDDRRPVLACDAAAAVLVAAWETSPDVYGWAVGRYAVMPDHVHFFAAVCKEDAKGLSEFIASWKRWTRRGMRTQGGSGLHLAAGVLRSCAAKRRVIWGEVGVRSDEPRPSRPGI